MFNRMTKKADFREIYRTNKGLTKADIPICGLKISKGARNSHPDEPAPTYGDYK